MTNVSVNPPKKRKPRRWRWQFSLRTFLLVTVVAGGVASWVASTYWREETKLPGGMVFREQLRSVDKSGGSDKLVPHGSFEAYDKHGRPRVAGHYDRGQPVGKWIVYHEDGRTALSGKATAGQRSGGWSSWNSAGRRTLDLAHGKPLGKQIHPNRDGVAKLSHSNGRLAATGPYKHDERDGAWTFYNVQGQKTAEGEYRAGLRHGLWTEYVAFRSAKGPTFAERKTTLDADETWYLSGRETENIDEQVKRLAAQAQGPDPGTQFEAVYALGTFGHWAALALATLLASDDTDLALAALRSLARLGPDGEEALPEIRRLAESKLPTVRLEALLALYAVDESQQGETFSRLLSQIDLEDRSGFTETAARLVELGLPTLPHLIAALESSDRNTRLRSLLVLARMVDLPRPPFYTRRDAPQWWDPLLLALDKATRHSDSLTSSTAREVRRLWAQDLSADAQPWYGSGLNVVG